MQDLETYLESCDRCYSAEHSMVRISFTSPGYHTRVPTGTWVHQTISSLEYAVLLLRTSEPTSWRRAADIFNKVMSLQDTNPASPTYGLWPYVLEEPIAAMEIPDRNWADFCGGRVAEALVEHPERLPVDLVRTMREALGHAAWRTFRDNIRPHYTNIAIMGAGTCAVAGEVLAEQRLVDYARKRLQRVVDHTRDAGSFNEYNSPAYTRIALEECERMLHLVCDPEVRAHAEELRQVASTVIAEHFHPGTQQWAGPHARTYTERLSSSGARFISERTGVPLHLEGLEPEGVWTGPLNLTTIPIPCPPHLVGHFRAAAQAHFEVVRRVIHRPDPKPPTHATTWMTPDMCLGSISRDNMLYQRRPVLGYWNTTAGTVATLRLRFLHDGRDFSSAYVCNAQRQNRVLSAVSLVTDMGDYSLALDRPANGVFHAEDFRLRYHLLAGAAKVTRVGESRFELAADPYRAVIHTLPGSFGPHPIHWETGTDASGAFVDAICYQGERKAFRPSDLGDVVLGVGMELLRGSEASYDSTIEVEKQSDGERRQIVLRWKGEPDLIVESPLQAGPYLWA